MNILRSLNDSLKNFVANLNTDRDKQAGEFYATPLFTYEQLANAFRGSWIARKIVVIPANDAIRRWREWNAEKDQIKLLENEEKRLALQGKTMDAMKSARLFGGAGIYIGIKNADPSLPLRVEEIKKGDLQYLTVIPKRVLTCGDLENDLLERYYGLPKYYEASSTLNQTRIHPSRIVRFVGAPFPDPEILSAQLQGWGDSSLTAAYEALRNADSIAANIGSLVYEAKVDVLGIPGLANIMQDVQSRAALVNRVELAAQLKGNNGMLIRDAEEEYDSKSFTFSGLTDIEQMALQVVSGAADIPITRFLGQSPSGLSSTGESDLRNYYDSVAAIQTLELDPEMDILNQVLIKSTLGVNPEDISYQWASLWQTSDSEKAENSKKVAETISILAQTRLFPDDDLSQAAVNMLIEHSVMPALEITGEIENEPEEEERVETEDSSVPRTLYVRRQVLNAKEIFNWAKGQGIKSIIPPDKMHVTVAFSTEPVDWMEVGQDWSGDEQGKLRIPPGGPRVFELMGEAQALKFVSNELNWRHERIKKAGASWDWNEFQPHISITFGPVPNNVEPYDGPIVLGPEIFEEVDENWRQTIVEVEV